ncbi:catechol 2,3-dioxygenase-like lactoylglutathione lyase family enzyme [Actinoplanes octamycinicus]|uniref:Catechol 2,3-dioxygenase-like lactoylglutathione lyase family enzyme n=1 Tax=Actinoplanes octamycinicus TaxID=135948 RepID=A0A7W7GXL5_9ACTN|nr:VOC family protein [Actinoplanes octamycinicus]MBB4740151.1 catechol 2,3-dioxygenase-like lactoylglutathione lyase family enzyme [Actinoplanes octamycinicus]GIE59548.1 glyoxalase/bleomycin resistance protein/dioxygenase [Actinoplanes octamycinicus]
MTIEHAALRIARPCTDLDAVGRFYLDGLGLAELFRKPDLLMAGPRGGSWHLELVAGHLRPTPTEEDLLVLYLGEPVDPALVARLVAHGGTVVPQGEYWDRWGVTVADPDGYRLVLSTRSWSN